MKKLNMITSLQFLFGLGVYADLHTLIKDYIDPYPVSDVSFAKNYGKMMNRISHLSNSNQMEILENYWQRFENKYGRESRISHQKKVIECDWFYDEEKWYDRSSVFITAAMMIWNNTFRRNE